MKISQSKVAKLLLAAFLLILVFRAVNFSELSAALSQMTLELIVALLLLSVFMIYISALKWRLILLGLPRENEDDESAVSTGRLFNLYLMGYFVNLIFPSYVGGDLVRSVQLGKCVGQVRALAATVFERYTGLVAMVALSFAFVWCIEGITPQIVLLVSAITVGTFAGTVIALFPMPDSLWQRLPLGAKISGATRKLQNSFHLVRRNKQLVVQALFISFLYHSLTVLNTALAGVAVGWHDPSFIKLFVVVPVILLIGAVPISPQGLGIQEGAFYFFLQVAGATPAQALGVALVLRAKSYVLALAGGVAWYFRPQSEIRVGESATRTS